jgi:hypothetical protein
MQNAKGIDDTRGVSRLILFSRKKRWRIYYKIMLADFSRRRVADLCRHSMNLFSQ